MAQLAFVHHSTVNLGEPHALERLRAMAQTAIQLELTAVPVYLFAMYSIKDRTSPAYQVLRSVVVEEMLHVNQACNLLVGIGGKPLLTGEAAPSYPTYLPSASKGDTPYLGLYRASLEVFQNVFMAVEMPAPYVAPAEGEKYATIGQFYKAFEVALEDCTRRFGPNTVFLHAQDTQQRQDLYMGKFGGRPIKVTDLWSARRAIRQIVQQGEGAVDPTHTLVSEEPWGSFDYYGQRLDGTYGPILGTPYELSHYFKFKRIVDAGEFPATFPCVSNPRAVDFQNSDARNKAVAFNKCYSVTLRSLELCFGGEAQAGGIFFELTLPLMHNVLPNLAALLLTTTILPEGDSTVGPTAGPPFEFDPKSSFDEALEAVNALETTASGDTSVALFNAAVPSAVAEERPRHGIDEVFKRVREDLSELRSVANGSNL